MKMKWIAPLASVTLLGATFAFGSTRGEIDLLRPYLADFEDFCRDALNNSGRCDAINDIGDYQREGETHQEACQDMRRLVTRCDRNLGRDHVSCRVFDALADDFCEEPPPAEPEPEPACGELDPNETLAVDEQVRSCDGRFRLIMQGDGNLVLYQGDSALWDSGTWGNPGATAIMQGDGNLVVYGSGGDALWDSGTWGNPGAMLVVQNDGNAVIYDEGVAIWATDTCCL